MARLRVAPIVEGHGEVEAVRILLVRIWHELLGGEYIDVLRPIGQNRSGIVRDRQRLCKAVGLASMKLADPANSSERGLILILLDADDDPACRLGPELLEAARACRADCDIACVLANVEYETWFVAAAASLDEWLDLPRELPTNPESARQGKKWIADRFRGLRYSETIEQPKFTHRMDLAQCRERSPSFDKLCRELEARFEQA